MVHLESNGLSNLVLWESSVSKCTATVITKLSLLIQACSHQSVPCLSPAPSFLPSGISLHKLSQASEDPFSPVVQHGAGLTLPARPAWEGLKASSPRRLRFT